MIIKICEICKKEFKTWPYRIKANVRFCSRKCKGIAFRGKMKYWLGKKFSLEHRKKMLGNKNGLIDGRYCNDKKKYHREKQRERMKNPEYRKKMSIYASNWAKRNKERKYYLNLKRLIMELNAEGEHSFMEWLQLKHKFNNKCLRCQKKEGEITLTQDHILPLSKNGTDYIENIQPLCKSCNSSKNDNYKDYRKGVYL